MYFWYRAAARNGIPHIFTVNFLGAVFTVKFLEFRKSTSIKFGEERPVNVSLALPTWVSDSRCVASFRNYSTSKVKFRPNFAHFTPSKN